MRRRPLVGSFVRRHRKRNDDDVDDDDDDDDDSSITKQQSREDLSLGRGSVLKIKVRLKVKNGKEKEEKTLLDLSIPSAWYCIGIIQPFPLLYEPSIVKVRLWPLFGPRSRRVSLAKPVKAIIEHGWNAAR